MLRMSARSRPLGYLGATLLALILTAGPASAQTPYFWNAPTGGLGDWNTSTMNWSTTSGGPVDVTWLNDGTVTANFANTAGTVTIADTINISAAGLNFTTDGYLINRVGTGTLTLAGTGGPIDVLTGNATISAPIGGTVGLTKTGTGTLTLSGTNTYTGVTNINAGTVAFTSTAGLGATGAGNQTVVASGASLTIGNNAINPGELLTLNGTGTANEGALRKIGTTNSNWTAAITLGSASRINSDTTMLLTLSGAISGTGQQLIVGGGGNTTISSAITTGVGGTLVKDGAGVLTLTNNASSGGSNFAAVDASSVVITINAGVISQPGEATGTAGSTTATGVIPSAAVPSYVLINGGTLRSTRTGVGATFLATNKGITLGASGGTLEVTDATAGNLNIYQGVITGSGGLTKSGPGVLALTAVQTYQGPTVVAGGTLRVRTTSERFPDSTALTVNTGAIFDLNGLNETVGSLAGAGNVNLTPATGSPGTFTSGGTNASTLFSGQFTELAITGGRVTKVGTGTLTLSGNNLHTGLTTISAGAIAVQSNTALGTTAGSTTVSSGAALLIDGNGLSIAEPLTLSGTGISSGGAVRNLANNNTLSGAITLNAATRINSDGGTLTFSNGITGTDRNLTVGGGGNATLNGVINTGTGTLTKDGAGTLILGAANTYTGATDINAGILQAGVASALPSGSAVTVGGSGTLALNNFGQVIASLAGSGTLNLGTAPATVLNTSGSTTTTFSGVITGIGQITRSGTGTTILSGNNTYDGQTNVNAGTLLVNTQTGSNSGTGVGSVFVNNGGTFGGNGRAGGGIYQVLSGGTIRGGNENQVGTLTLDGILDVSDGANVGVRLNDATPTPSSGTPGGSTEGTPPSPTSNNFINVTSGGLIGNLANLNYRVDGTGSPFVFGVTYSYQIATIVGQDMSAVNVTDPARFTGIGFSEPNLQFSLTGNSSGALFINFTPVPEPATVLGLAAGALAAGGFIRRRLIRRA